MSERRPSNEDLLQIEWVLKEAGSKKVSFSEMMGCDAVLVIRPPRGAAPAPSQTRSRSRSARSMPRLSGASDFPELTPEEWEAMLSED